MECKRVVSPRSPSSAFAGSLLGEEDTDFPLLPLATCTNYANPQAWQLQGLSSCPTARLRVKRRRRVLRKEDGQTVCGVANSMRGSTGLVFYLRKNRSDDLSSLARKQNAPCRSSKKVCQHKNARIGALHSLGPLNIPTANRCTVGCARFSPLTRSLSNH